MQRYVLLEQSSWTYSCFLPKISKVTISELTIVTCPKLVKWLVICLTFLLTAEA